MFIKNGKAENIKNIALVFNSLKVKIFQFLEFLSYSVGAKAADLTLISVC